MIFFLEVRWDTYNPSTKEVIRYPYLILNRFTNYTPLLFSSTRSSTGSPRKMAWSTTGALRLLHQQNVFPVSRILLMATPFPSAAAQRLIPALVLPHHLPALTPLRHLQPLRCLQPLCRLQPMRYPQPLRHHPLPRHPLPQSLELALPNPL